MNKKYFPEIAIYRGFAIFTIVFIHMFLAVGGLAGVCNLPSNEGSIHKFAVSFIIDNTTLFVFISGFLFYHVFYQTRVKFKEFMIGKIQNVFCPYLCVLPFMIALQYYFRSNVFFYSPLWNGIDDFINYTLSYCSLWYIPFVMLLFAFFHLHLIFIYFNDNYKKLTIAIFMLLAVIVGRDDFNQIHMVLYLSVFYLLGIYSALHYNYIKSLNLICTIGIVEIYFLFNYMCVEMGHFNSIHKSFGEKILDLDYTVLSKVILCIALLKIFMFLAEWQSNLVQKILDILGKYSFPIFFLHNFIIYILLEYFTNHLHVTDLSNNLALVWFVSILFSFITCCICIIIAFYIKKIFGSKSKMIIGV